MLLLSSFAIELCKSDTLDLLFNYFDADKPEQVAVGIISSLASHCNRCPLCCFVVEQDPKSLQVWQCCFVRLNLTSLCKVGELFRLQLVIIFLRALSFWIQQLKQLAQLLVQSIKCRKWKNSGDSGRKKPQNNTSQFPKTPELTVFCAMQQTVEHPPIRVAEKENVWYFYLQI